MVTLHLSSRTRWELKSIDLVARSALAFGLVKISSFLVSNYSRGEKNAAGEPFPPQTVSSSTAAPFPFVNACK